MLRDTNSLIGFRIHAANGELGKVDEFYFDDKTWEIRYMVVSTGTWLSGRKVLISKAAIKKPEWGSRSVQVALTLDQVRNSPDIDTKKTVTRRHELELHEHYAWPLYWGEGFYGGSMSGSPLFMEGGTEEKKERPVPDDEAHLQGTGAVTGYNLHAADGPIGRVENFIVNDADWKIRYLVADTGNWLPGRKVLVSPHWIEDVRWETAEVFVDLTQEAVRKSPEFDPSIPVSEDYESELYDHYGRPKLWSGAERPAAGSKR